VVHKKTAMVWTCFNKGWW